MSDGKRVMEKKKVLILGSLGMLGQELVRVFSIDEKYQVVAWDKDDADITDFKKLEERLREAAPEVVINAAAYNAVDKCEEDNLEFERALELNRDVPAFLAEQSKKQGFVLVHYSTDYVFDGALEENLVRTGCCGGGCCGNGGGGESGKVGYNEESLPNPISCYGESKYAGERAIGVKAEKYYIIRLSKLFGKAGTSPQGKRSFFEVMLEAAKSKEVVEVVHAEKSCFTYAPDLAEATKALTESDDAFGIYHLVNSGGVTWYEAVLELYREAGIQTPVIPIQSDAFPRPAKRPSCSVLLNSKRPLLRPYTEALKEYLKSI